MKKFNRALAQIKARARGTDKPRSGELPPEVWTIVFKIGEFKVRDISRVRLACRMFAALAKAQAFCHFTFRPCDEESTYKDPKAIHHKALAFWTSEAIAPFVRECTVSSAFAYSARGMHGLPLEVFFQRLTKFIHLTSIQFQFVPFDNIALSQLGQLKQLQTITLIDCTIIAQSTPAVVTVPHVQLRSYTRLVDSRERGRFGWLDVFSAQATRRLHIAFSESRVVHLRGVTTTGSPAPASEADCVKEHFMQLLMHFGSLEELRVEPFETCPGGDDNPYKFHVNLPSLRLFDGPSDLWECFPAGDALTELTLHPLCRNRYLSARDVQELRLSASIRSLTMYVSELSRALLEKIAHRCPQLLHLDLRVSRIDIQVRAAHGLMREPLLILVSRNCAMWCLRFLFSWRRSSLLHQQRAHFAHNGMRWCMI